jgi:hypothetical protein
VTIHRNQEHTVAEATGLPLEMPPPLWRTLGLPRRHAYAGGSLLVRQEGGPR